VPYYVAAHLDAGVDSFLYAALLGRFEELARALKAPPECRPAGRGRVRVDSIY
jgi:hypothetical protein